MFAVLPGCVFLLSASVHVLMQYPGEPWYVIGHSMGAAMATLCALDLRFRLQPVPDVSAVASVMPAGAAVQSVPPLASYNIPRTMPDIKCMIDAGAGVYFWVAAGGQ